MESWSVEVVIDCIWFLITPLLQNSSHSYKAIYVQR
jgi:hypothetical protein